MWVVHRRGVEIRGDVKELRELNRDELAQVCAELRARMVSTVLETGGHLSVQPGRRGDSRGPAPGLRFFKGPHPVGRGAPGVCA